MNSENIQQKHAHYGRMPIFEWDESVSMCYGDEETARNLLKVCAEEIESSKQKIEKHYKCMDAQLLRDELHKVRGGVCYLKIPELEHTLEAFHAVVKESFQDKDRLKKAYQALENSEERFLEFYNNSDFEK